MPRRTKQSAVLRGATVLIAAMAGFATFLPWSAPSPAAEPMAFAVPVEEGYGIADCLEPGLSCGAAIADSWCEAHGHVKSVAFGAVADVTGSIAAASTAAPTRTGDVLIRCTD